MCSHHTGPQLAPIIRGQTTYLYAVSYEYRDVWFFPTLIQGSSAFLYKLSVKVKVRKFPFFYAVGRYRFHKFPSLVLITYAVNPVHRHKHTCTHIPYFFEVEHEIILPSMSTIHVVSSLACIFWLFLNFYSIPLAIVALLTHEIRVTLIHMLYSSNTLRGIALDKYLTFEIVLMLHILNDVIPDHHAYFAV